MQERCNATRKECLQCDTKLKTHIERILQLLCKAVAFEVKAWSLVSSLLIRLLQAPIYLLQVLFLYDITQCSKHDLVAVAKEARKAD